MVDFWSYINGFRKGKHAHRIEKEAMTDPFLSDAIEGYDSVKGNHEKSISRLQERINQQTKKKRISPVWWAAASLLLIIGFATFYLWTDKQKNIIISHDISHIESITEQNIAEINTRSEENISQEESSQLNETEKIAEIAENKDIQKIRDSKDFVLNDEREYSSADMTVSEEVINIKQSTSTPPPPPAMPQASIKEEAKVQADIAYDKKNGSDYIRGKIVDESGESIIGANVVVKGTTNGAVTDMDGYFFFKADSLSNNKTLTVSNLGYQRKDVKVDKDKPMLITLHEENMALAEVVVAAKSNKRNEMAAAASKISISTEEYGDVAPKPQPVIGMKAYKEYLKSNAKLSGDSSNSKGKVTVSFYLDASGKPYNIQVEKSTCPDCNKKAIELIQNGSSWTPSTGNELIKVDVEFRK